MREVKEKFGIGIATLLITFGIGTAITSCGDDDDQIPRTNEELVWQQYIHPETHEAIWCLVEYSGDSVVCP